MKKVCISLALLGWLWTVPAVAQDAGWINHFEGTSENYLLKRGDETVPVALFTVVQVGDEISVKEKQPAIELSLRGGTQSVKVTDENSPFLIKPDSQVPASLDKLWAWTTLRFGEWRKLVSEVPDASEQNQCASLFMPLLDNVTGYARLVAGKRPLHLQWYGGEAPYGVLMKQGRKYLLTKTSPTPTIETEALSFKAGKSYRVMVFDSTGQSFKRGFLVINSSRVSVPELEEAPLPNNVRKTLLAIWLAVQGNGNLNFEAYQQVAPLTDYKPAGLLKKALGVTQEAQNCRGIRG
ncbi:MAG: hypothetical protein DRR19_25310 [Candidatus Parabeggiatoa sp. nov. 1]|nr:MAG: hypothetical protein DRR19_25310 [Gammaproteobacteria bacterium]